MPRRTHPRPRAKHPRAETRYQRERYIQKRWRLGKRLYGDDFWLSRDLSRPGPVEAEPERLRHALGQVGPMLFVHPEVARRLEGWACWRAPWPFGLEPGRFARNRFTRCSCVACSWERRFDPRRAREWREWRRGPQRTPANGPVPLAPRAPLGHWSRFLARGILGGRCRRRTSS